MGVAVLQAALVAGVALSVARGGEGHGLVGGRGAGLRPSGALAADGARAAAGAAEGAIAAAGGGGEERVGAAGPSVPRVAVQVETEEAAESSTWTDGACWEVADPQDQQEEHRCSGSGAKQSLAEARRHSSRRQRYPSPHTLASVAATATATACAPSSLVQKRLLSLRGGVKRAAAAAALDGEEDDDDDDDFPASESVLKKVVSSYAALPIATRVYLSVVLACTAIDMAGGEALNAGELFALHPRRSLLGLELWRPLTGSTFLGPLSMHWATNVYFLIKYGTLLEAMYGHAQQLVFLVVVVAVLNVLGPLLGFPYVATSLISSLVYVSSRLNPMENQQWQFGITIQSWMLPYALAIVDTLQAQSIAAAYPHLLGILAGHLYHFFNKVYPAMGGRAWFNAPNWMKRRLDGDEPSYMAAAEEAAAKAPKPRGRRVGGGRKDDD